MAGPPRSQLTFFIFFSIFENGQLPPDVPSTTPLRLYRPSRRVTPMTGSFMAEA
jgi:hypothetical protein